MDIGVFSRTFSRDTLGELLDAIAAHGVSQVHFNMKGAGVPNLPEEIDARLCNTVRIAFAERALTMCSLSGTYNMIHPDPEQREVETGRACRLIERAPQMGTSIVTTCTGTRDPVDMWRRHPANDRPDAWRDLLATLDRLLPVAEKSGVILGIETEPNNVVNSAAKARRLLDELRSPNLKIVMDGANLFDEDLSDMRGVLSEAFQLLAPDIVMAHAKDIPGERGARSQAAGRGLLDWETYFRLLNEYRYPGVVVLHNLSESELDDSLRFVRGHLAGAANAQAAGDRHALS